MSVEVHYGAHLDKFDNNMANVDFGRINLSFSPSNVKQQNSAREERSTVFASRNYQWHNLRRVRFAWRLFTKEACCGCVYVLSG